MNSKLFYESNKEIMPSFSAPDYSLDDNGIADWIFSTMPPYIELDIEFDVNQLNQQNFQLLNQLPNIIQDSGEVGEFEIDIFRVIISHIEEYQHNLIKV